RPLLFFFQAEDGIRDGHVTGVQTCALPICIWSVDPTVGNLAAALFDAQNGLEPRVALLRRLGLRLRIRASASTPSRQVLAYAREIGRASCRERVQKVEEGMPGEHKSEGRRA